MIVSRRNIRFLLLALAIVVLAAFAYTLFYISSSYKKQISISNAKNIEVINSKISSYQKGIEDIILNSVSEKESNNKKTILPPFIHLLSSSADSSRVNFDNIYLVNSDLFPIKTVLASSGDLWIKSTISYEFGMVDYAYLQDRLMSHLNDADVTSSFILLNSNGNETITIGLNDETIQKALPKQLSSKTTIKVKNSDYCVHMIADILSSSNKIVGHYYALNDITLLHNAYKSIFVLTILVGIFAFVSLLFLYKFLTKSFNERLKAQITIEKFRSNDIINSLGNYQIKQIFNATKNGVRIINTNFDILAVNNAFCKISGLENEKLEGEKCYTVFHGIYCHTANCPLERLKNGDVNVESNEFRFKRDGKKVRCIYSATPLFDSDNNLLGIVEDFKDVSEKFAVEETLKQTEKQFEVFMDSLPVGVFIEDGITHEILYQNTYLKTITGGGSVKSFLPEESSEKLSKSYLESEEENQILDVAGNWRYFLTHKFKFLGVNNQLKIGGIMIDITKKKEVEQYRDVLSKAIENSPVSVAILSPDTEVEFINPTFSTLTGYTIDEIYSREILNLNIEYNSGSNLAKAVESIKNGQIWQGEIHLKNRNGDHFWVSASFTPIINEDGKVQHSVAIMENITKRKEFEKEILFAKSKAEESDKLKSAFLSNLSHEIRTPLNAIIGFSSLLTDNDLSFGERRNISEIIYRNSNDLLRLIENLIEISEIETGQLMIKKKEFSVNAMMSDLYRQLIEEDKKATNVKLSLRKEIYGDDLVIFSDQTRVQQVLFQLLTNSCKFTENGFIEFGYSLKDEATLMFYVVDSGIGIEPEKQALVFNPFRQVDDSNTRRYGGMGLGLAISKHIVEKLGGKIWINSTPKSGTSVYFTIPFIPVNSKFEFDNHTIIKKHYEWNNKTILVADDIDANFVYLKAALKNTNANVIWAKNGVEAVDFVKQGSDINLILMDLVMPELDGFEATRLIKDINNQIPIIGQTAYPSQKNYSFAKEIGFDSMLEKPIKVNRMLMELDKYLSN
ncbi:MAG TPA: PAS domain S-box protein [Tenuifilaceae bacterium]|nr:PAS domain S-box protein [Tenuifilaceae bacterium]HPN20458.1 PAS domain S-box protein [Tenuifilaceae bacterium]